MKPTQSHVSRGIVFGVFDGLHEGHTFFLSQAAQRCDTLTVVVTRSEMVLAMKGKAPMNDYEARADAIRHFNPKAHVISGDAVHGSWKVLEDHTPHMVFLGHDQQGIAAELDRMNIPYQWIDSHKPEVYKSSLLRRG